VERRGAALAVILARAGSNGVPGKNWAMVGGKPCIEWTIDAAMRSALVREVVISTDSPRVRDIAAAMNVRAIARPAELATDTATVDEAARHAAAETTEPVIMLLYANVPVRPAGLIDRAIRLLLSSGADSVQSYAPVGKHHPWWTCRVEEASGVVRPWEGDVLYHNAFRRQDLPPAFVPDGGVCAVTREALYKRVPGAGAGPHAFLGRPAHRRGIITGEGEVIDIDSRTDLIVADTVLRTVA
jgi:CMP-N-acetylneuraminic acid synthetase